METKSLFKSKTFLVAALTFAAGVLTLASQTFGNILSPEIMGYVLVGLGIVNTVLRLFTSTPVTLTSNGTD